MTDAQTRFLKKLLHAALTKTEGRSEWIEVGDFVGIPMKTVDKFDKLGLIETESRGSDGTQTWARLIDPKEGQL